MAQPPPKYTLFPYTTLFRSKMKAEGETGYEPSLLISMEAEQTLEHGAVRTIDNVATVLKDRSDVMNGKDRKSTRNSSHTVISYAVFCLKKKKIKINSHRQKP